MHVFFEFKNKKGFCVFLAGIMELAQECIIMAEVNDTMLGFDDAIRIVNGLLTTGVVEEFRDFNDDKGHDVIRVLYALTFDLSSVQHQLKAQLDRIEWQFAARNDTYHNQLHTFKCFDIAPIVHRRINTAYHATRTRVVPNILRDGLLPGTPERAATGWPDTEGKIFVCAILVECGHKDSAMWWRDHLRQQNRFNDPDWSIVEIDMKELIGARVYQDLRSESGLVVDRITAISPARIKRVCSAGKA